MKLPNLTTRQMYNLSFGLVMLMLLDTSINMAMQPFKMMVGDVVNEEQKAAAYSIQSLLCNAGSLVGFLFPYIFTWIGISNVAPEGVIPDSVIYSFYVGAAILILCVLFTGFNVKEMAPEEYAKYHPAPVQTEKSEGFVTLLMKAPAAFCAAYRRRGPFAPRRCIWACPTPRR